MSKLDKVSRILGLIGSIIATIVSFSYYLLLVEAYNYNQARIISLIVVLLGIIASIISIIASSIMSITKRFANIAFFATSAILLAALITVMIELAQNNMALTTMPFYAIPLTLILTAGVFSVIPAKEQK